MPSPSATILDPASDASREELARLTKVYSFPDFVKKADLDATMFPRQVAATTFADPANRKFACHSAAATWLSGLYFNEKKAEYHPKDRERIEQRLIKFAEYFKIKPAYDSMCKQASALHSETELPDSSFAYVWAGSDGVKARHLPMRSTAEVKAAADWLERYQDRLPFQDRNTIAIKILEKAASYGAGLDNDEFMEKQAGRGVCDPEEVYTAIMQRACLTKSAAHRTQIEALAETVKVQPSIALQPDQLVKLAVVLDMTDRALNLTDKYGDLIRRPEDVIFKVTFMKAAADSAELCALTTGNIYTREQFNKLSRDEVSALFGDDFASEVCSGLDVDAEKMAEVAHTLPRPDAELLDQLMAECGLPPQMSKSASYSHGLSNLELEMMAEKYKAPKTSRQSLLA